MDNNIKSKKTEDKTFLTLEERLEMAAKSQASSPEAAAGLVQRLSKTHSVYFFCENANLNRMYELIGEYMNQLDEEVLWYSGFCQSFRLAMDSNNGFFQLPSLEMPLAEEWDPYRPIWGFRLNDAMVLLGLMLLDHAKGRMKNKEIYHCMRMTLGQYLDALVDISFRKDGTHDWGRAECFRTYRNMLLKDYDDFKPLGEALADILRRYIAAWREFNRLDHILGCMEELFGHLEREALPPEEYENFRLFLEDINQYVSELEGAEIEEECLDPWGYYSKLACQVLEDVPDPSSENIAPGALYDRFFLPGRDYHPNSLQKLAAQSPSLDMRALLEKYICEERIASSMRELNVAVTDIYILFVEPYLWMREYHYERHLES